MGEPLVYPIENSGGAFFYRERDYNGYIDVQDLQIVYDSVACYSGIGIMLNRYVAIVLKYRNTREKLC